MCVRTVWTFIHRSWIVLACVFQSALFVSLRTGGGLSDAQEADDR